MSEKSGLDYRVRGMSTQKAGYNAGKDTESSARTSEGAVRKSDNKATL